MIGARAIIRGTRVRIVRDGSTRPWPASCAAPWQLGCGISEPANLRQAATVITMPDADGCVVIMPDNYADAPLDSSQGQIVLIGWRVPVWALEECACSPTANLPTPTPGS